MRSDNGDCTMDEWKTSNRGRKRPKVPRTIRMEQKTLDYFEQLATECGGDVSTLMAEALGCAASSSWTPGSELEGTQSAAHLKEVVKASLREVMDERDQGAA